MDARGFSIFHVKVIFVKSCHQQKIIKYIYGSINVQHIANNFHLIFKLFI